MKKKILKFFIKNKQIKNEKRVFLYRSLTLIKRKHSITKSRFICLLTSRQSSIKKKYMISRHSFKRMSKFGLTNNSKSL